MINFFDDGLVQRSKGPGKVAWNAQIVASWLLAKTKMRIMINIFHGDRDPKMDTLYLEVSKIY